MIKKLLLSLLAILFLPLFFSGDSFAVSDVTYTIDQDTPNNTDFCNSSCSTYKYIYIHDIVIPFSNNSFSFNLKLSDQFDNYHVLGFSLNARFIPPFLLYNVDLSTLSQNAFIVEKSYVPSNVNWSFKVTLSENNPTESSSSNPSGSLSITENGTYDVTNYAEAVVNVPTETTVTELPPYSELVVDSFWQYHKSFAGAVVALIVIFLVYRVLKGRLR